MRKLPQFPKRRAQSSPEPAGHVSSNESALESASAMPWTRMRYLKLLVIFTVVSTALGTIIFIALPYRRWLLREDNVVENLSVFFYLLATLVATFRLIKRQRTDQRPGWLLGVAAIGIIGALEELSYGHRLLGYSVPSVAGVELDALHDFASIALRIIETNYATNVLPIAIFCCVCAGLFLWSVARYRRRVIAALQSSQPMAILTCLALLIAAASLIDLEILKIKYLPLRVYEEIFEMNAAFAAFLLSLVVANPALE